METKSVVWMVVWMVEQTAVYLAGKMVAHSACVMVAHSVVLLGLRMVE